MSDFSSSYPPKLSPIVGSFEDCLPEWSFAAVQGRLVDARRCLDRLPAGRSTGHAAPSWYYLYDRTEGMTRAELLIWREEQAKDRIFRAPPSRDEIARMYEAMTWLEWIDSDASRKIVVDAIGWLVRNRLSKRIAWAQLVRGRPEAGSAESVRKAYGRALTDICGRLNAQ